MSGPRRLTEAERDRIVEMREAGSTFRAIARAVGCSESAVSWHCLKLFAEPPKPQRLRVGIVGPEVMNRSGHIVRRFSEVEDHRLLELESQGLREAEIARRIGRRSNSVRGRLMTLARREARSEAATR